MVWTWVSSCQNVLKIRSCLEILEIGRLIRVKIRVYTTLGLKFVWTLEEGKGHKVPSPLGELPSDPSESDQKSKYWINRPGMGFLLEWNRMSHLHPNVISKHLISKRLHGIKQGSLEQTHLEFSWMLKNAQDIFDFLFI